MTNSFIQPQRKTDHRYERKFDNVEVAVSYLEADLWKDGSGYNKEYYARLLCRLRIRSQHEERLRKVILANIDKCYCREFGQYKRLAYKVDSPALRSEIKVRLNHENRHIRRHANWLVEYFIARDAQKKLRYIWQE